MNAILQFVLKHGYSVLFAAMFAHQIGVPMPGPLFLLSAGALAAAGKLGFLAVLGLTTSACVLADLVWYEAGRCGGERVLHFIHRFTRDPEFHDRNAKRIFTRYGLLLLLVAKFVPGLDAVAPPLAAISRTNRVNFLVFDALGAGLYGCVYGGIGYGFSHDLDRAAAYVSRAGTLCASLALGGISVYTAGRLLQKFRYVRDSRVLRVTPIESIEYQDSLNTALRVVGEQNDGK